MKGRSSIIRIKALLAATLILSLFPAAGKAADITVVTENWPPFQEIVNERVDGIATQVARAVLEEAGLTAIFEIYPWARAYNMARTQRNTMIYSISRMPSREHLFHWIGTIVPYRNHLWKLRSRRDIVIDSLADAKRYKMGGRNQDVKTQYLVEHHGFRIHEHIFVVSNDLQNLKKLLAGRIDYFPFDELGIMHKMDILGKDMALIEKAYTFTEGPLASDLYMALSIDSDDVLLKRLQRALATVKANGVCQRILSQTLYDIQSNVRHTAF